jgi:hypothetical protein
VTCRLHYAFPGVRFWEPVGSGRVPHGSCAIMDGMTTESDAWIERHVALGLVVSYAAQMEAGLRYCFRVLEGGKYSAIVAAGQQVTWLIDYGRTIVKTHTDLDKARKTAVLDALKACAAANERRNELVHSIHFWPGTSVGEPADYGITMRSRKRSAALAASEWTIAEIREAAWALMEAGQLLREAIDDIAGVPGGQPDWIRY